MKKQIRLLLFAIFVFIVICLYNTNDVKAASASISDNQTVEAGQTVTVTATVTAGAWNLTLSGGGQTQYLIGQTSIAGNQTASTSITFTANSDTTVYLTGDITDFSSETSEPVSRSTQITVTTPSTPTTEPEPETPSTPTTTEPTQPETPSTPTTPEKSSVATLSNLGIRPNDFTGFRPYTYSYNVEVPNEVDSIEVYASEGQSGQTISGRGTKTLEEGVNTFSIVVTAEAGNTQTYTINVTRKQAEQTEEEPEENSEEDPMEEAFGLTELKIEGLELEPQFQTDIYEYEIELREDLEKLNITTLATKANSEVEITGNENLQEGENIITIIVKGESEAETVAYQIIVNKILEIEEDTTNQEQQGNTQRIIIAAIAGGVIVIIIVVILISKIKKFKGQNAGYIPYEGLDDDDEEDNYDDSYNNYNDNYEDDNFYQNDNNTENKIEDDEEDGFYEEVIKKHSKGKRFK